MVRLHRLKSRQRVAIRIGLALIVLLSLGGFITARAVDGELRDRMDAQLGEDAVEVTAVIELFDDEEIAELSEGITDASFEFDRAEWAGAVLSPDAEPLYLGFGPTDAEASPDVLDTPIAELRGRAGEPFAVDSVSGDDDAYRVLTFPLVDGRVGVVSRSLDGVETVSQILHKSFTIATIVTVIVLALIVWMISRHVLKPLEDMVDTAHAIGEGNLDARVSVGRMAPDLERLRDAMNTMVSRLQRAFDQQERSEARLRQFVSNASHELRTPLAAVLGHAELYHEKMARSPEQVDQAMRVITAEGTRMSSLIEDLLLLARLDEGRPLASDAVDLGAVVDAAVASIATVDCEHRFVAESRDEPVHVVADEQALCQVVDNLLTNVVAHTPPGTTARISVTAGGGKHGDSDADREVRLVVADDGPGMDPDVAEHVFDRFVRAETSRARTNGSLGGNGLGLSIVHELVRAHGGTITVDSHPGAGATFTISIPRRVDAPPPEQPDPAAVPPVTTSTTERG